MSLVIEKSTSFTPMSEGVHQAVIAKAEDLGDAPNKYYDANDPKSKPTKRALRVVLLNAKGEEARRYYTASLHEKASLAKDLKSIFGTVPDKVDVAKLVGTQCQVVVTSERGSDGKTRAKIQSFLKPAEGQKVPLPDASRLSNLEITDEDIPF